MFDENSKPLPPPPYKTQPYGNLPPLHVILLFQKVYTLFFGCQQVQIANGSLLAEVFLSLSPVAELCPTAVGLELCWCGVWQKSTNGQIERMRYFPSVHRRITSFTWC